MESNQVTLEQLAAALQSVRADLANANTHIGVLNNELNETKAHLHQAAASSSKPLAKVKKPESFNGTGSVLSWTAHMANYLRLSSDSEAFQIAVSYLEGNAHEWWLVFKDSAEGQSIRAWHTLRNALIQRFDTLNKRKVARDRLAVQKQTSNAASFNEEFQKIILNIPDISSEEQVDRYTRGLKSYIW